MKYFRVGQRVKVISKKHQDTFMQIGIITTIMLYNTNVKNNDKLIEIRINKVHSYYHPEELEIVMPYKRIIKGILSKNEI